MRIGIAYNLKSDIENIIPRNLLMEDAFEEFDTEETIDAVASAFEKNNHSVVRLGWGKKAIKALLSQDIDFVFNMSEGFSGRNREAQMPSVLEIFEIPYSGSDPLTLSLTLDKVIAKQILKQNNIKAPDYFVVNKIQDLDMLPYGLKYPLFVKPAWEGSSKGIKQSSKALKKEELISYTKYILENYPGQPVLIEHYIQGREFTVGILGNQEPKILGLMEITPKTKGCKDFFYSIEVKRDWENLVTYECPAKIELALNKRLEYSAIKAFKAFGCRDLARVDFRVNSLGEVYFIEINPLPGLSPKYSDIVIMARKMGWAYEGFIMEIFNSAFGRINSCEAPPLFFQARGEAE